MTKIWKYIVGAFGAVLLALGTLLGLYFKGKSDAKKENTPKPEPMPISPGYELAKAVTSAKDQPERDALVDKFIRDGIPK
jgi:hypothetical protein